MDLRFENGIFIGKDDIEYTKGDKLSLDKKLPKAIIHLYNSEAKENAEDDDWDCKVFKAVVYDWEDRKYYVYENVESIVNECGCASIIQNFKDGSACVCISNCRLMVGSNIVVLPYTKETGVNSFNPKNVYYVKGDSIYYEDVKINNPSILVDKGVDMVDKIGDYGSLKDYHRMSWRSYMNMGQKQMAEDLVLIDLNEKVPDLSLEDTCKILNCFKEHSGIPDTVQWFIDETDSNKIKDWLANIQ